MIRRPPRSTLDRSSAASDVYKRQALLDIILYGMPENEYVELESGFDDENALKLGFQGVFSQISVSYTHLRAHETVLDLVCRLLLEKKKLSNLYYHNYFYMIS